MTITYTIREALNIGDTISIPSRFGSAASTLTMVDFLGYDAAGRHGIKWSNGVTEFADPATRVALVVQDAPIEIHFIFTWGPLAGTPGMVTFRHESDAAEFMSRAQYKGIEITSH